MEEIDTKCSLTKHFKFSPSTCTVTLTKQSLFEKNSLQWLSAYLLWGALQRHCGIR